MTELCHVALNKAQLKLLVMMIRLTFIRDGHKLTEEQINDLNKLEDNFAWWLGHLGKAGEPDDE